ncbi:MAG: helix-turn-helix domain-containing protein [Magnetospirillum sp.]|nr:helix-turn-helix domain-containing protein [Magnetospirillum sp.]
MKIVQKETLLDRRLLVGEMVRDKCLNDAARRIGWFLLNRVNQQTGTCWPGYERLAEDSGLSRATVARAINMLIKCSYFSYRQGGGKRQANYPGEEIGRTNTYIPIYESDQRPAGMLPFLDDD